MYVWKKIVFFDYIGRSRVSKPMHQLLLTSACRRRRRRREMTDDEVGHLYHILQRAFGIGSTSTSTVLLSLLCPSILLLHCTQNVPFSLYKIQVQLHYYSVPAKQLLYPIPNFAAWSYPPFFACALLWLLRLFLMGHVHGHGQRIFGPCCACASGHKISYPYHLRIVHHRKCMARTCSNHCSCAYMCSIGNAILTIQRDVTT